ncbi:MAG: DUF2341 domain-containing protein [Kiritimatiellae bacterium]|nr:DUF2341 domain-containing protein [Kiritimatiellia bacterium]
MKNRLLPAVAAFVAAIQLCPTARGAVSGYSRMATLTVAGAAEGVTLENFPVLVRVSPDRISGFEYSQLSSPEDGADLRFTDDDGNFLNFDIDTWNPDGESLVWVSVPTFARGTQIVMRWGNPSPAEPNDPTAVWSVPGYVQVWHFSSGVTTDATGRGLSLKASGGFVPSTDSFLGGCYTNEVAGQEIVNEDGSKTWSYIDLSRHDNLLSDITTRTVTGWFRQDENFAKSDVWTSYFSNKNSLGDNGINVTFLNENLWIYGNGQNAHGGGWGHVTYDVGAWMHIAARFRTDPDDGAVKGALFRDGSPYFSETTLPDGISEYGGVFSVGNYGGWHSYRNDPFHGDIDEIRIFDGALSAEWILEERNTAWSESYLQYGNAVVFVEDFTGFLRSDSAAQLPAEFGEASATFDGDVSAAVAAAVAAKDAGARKSVLYVAPGEYIASAPIRATNGVSVIGLGSAADAIFAGTADPAEQWNFRVMNFAGGGLLANLTIRGNRRTGFDNDDGLNGGRWDEPRRYGGTLLLGAADETLTSVASNIVVTGGYSGRWANNEFLGTVAVRGNGLLVDSEITGNKIGGYGGGVFAEGSAMVLRCRITDNSVWDLGAGKLYGGGANLRGGAKLVDCLVAGNDSSTGPGGGVQMDLASDDGGLFHCTVAGNTAEGAGTGVFVKTDKGRIFDTIVAGGEGSLATGLSSASSVTIANCCFDAEPPAAFTKKTDVLVADPEFKSGGFELLASSPCIDAAAADSEPVAGLGKTSTWIALNGVPHSHDDENDSFDGLPDIGCYESTSANARTLVIYVR